LVKRSEEKGAARRVKECSDERCTKENVAVSSEN
jgi:hypothetical protein